MEKSNIRSFFVVKGIFEGIFLISFIMLLSFLLLQKGMGLNSDYFGITPYLMLSFCVVYTFIFIFKRMMVPLESCKIKGTPYKRVLAVTFFSASLVMLFVVLTYGILRLMYVGPPMNIKIIAWYDYLYWVTATIYALMLIFYSRLFPRK